MQHHNFHRQLLPAQPKVLHFVHGGGTGSTRRVVDLCKAHQKQRIFECYLVLRGRPFDQNLAAEMQSLGVGFFVIDSTSPLAIMHKLIKILNTVRPEAMLSHGYHEHIHGRLAAIIARIPVIIHVERNIEHYTPMTHLTSRFLCIFTKKIICVSSAVRSALAQKGYNPQKLKVIHNGFQLERYRPPNGNTYENRKNQIVMIARFGVQKDQATLLRALKLVLQAGQRVELLLVGGADRNKDYLKRIKDLCSQLELTNFVKFLGVQKNIPDLLWESKIFVLSTHYEGLSGVVIEALAAGCAVIASDVPGVSELIRHEKTGWLVPENDPFKLACAINKALSRTDYAASVAQNGQRYAETMFNLTTMSNAYTNFLLEEIKP